MLIIARREGERVYIEGGICILITKINRHTVWLGITAPKSVRIEREEILAPSDPRRVREEKR